METANNITINTDDKNLAEVIKKIIAEAGLTIADLFDDDEVCDHIHESGMSADVVYDEDDILDCGCVTDKIQELEDQIAELEERNDELDTKNAKLKKKNAKLAKERDDYDECLARIQSAMLEDANMRKAFEGRWNKRFVDDDTLLEGVECRKCGITLPPHTVRTHLTVGDPIHTCPHKTDEDDEKDELNSAIDASGNALY